MALSGLAILIAVLSFREARRANRRADRVEINLDVEELVYKTSAYADLLPTDVTAQGFFTLNVVGDGAARNVIVRARYPSVNEALEIARFPILGGGAQRKIAADLCPDPKDVVEVSVVWTDVDRVKETPTLTFRRPRSTEGGDLTVV